MCSRDPQNFQQTRPAHRLGHLWAALPTPAHSCPWGDPWTPSTPFCLGGHTGTPSPLPMADWPRRAMVLCQNHKGQQTQQHPPTKALTSRTDVALTSAHAKKVSKVNRAGQYD